MLQLGWENIVRGNHKTRWSDGHVDSTQEQSSLLDTDHHHRSHCVGACTPRLNPSTTMSPAECPSFHHSPHLIYRLFSPTSPSLPPLFPLPTKLSRANANDPRWDIVPPSLSVPSVIITTHCFHKLLSLARSRNSHPFSCSPLLSPSSNFILLKINKSHQNFLCSCKVTFAIS